MLHGEHMHRPSSWLFLFAIFSLCLAVPCPSAADERILSYDVSATLEKDSSLRVVERITVNVERKRIKRDFPRSFPIKEILSGNKMRHHGFEVLFAKCDGRDVPYTRQDKGCATDILIGNENRLLSFGIHIYELAYRTTGHVRFLNSHDELAFSVIGLDNQFPVDSASFTLRLPPEAVVQGTWAYTGKPGDENADCEKIGPAAFKTTRILNRHEGMTVVAAWQKGVVTLPLETQLNWMGRNRTRSSECRCCTCISSCIKMAGLSSRSFRLMTMYRPQLNEGVSCSRITSRQPSRSSFSPRRMSRTIFQADTAYNTSVTTAPAT